MSRVYGGGERAVSDSPGWVWWTRVNKCWQRFCGRDDLMYFQVTFRTRDSEREYREDGLLSAETIHQAMSKAEMARKVLDEPGYEGFCDYERIVQISKMEYKVGKLRIIDVDSFFDRHGNLI